MIQTFENKNLVSGDKKIEGMIIPFKRIKTGQSLTSTSNASMFLQDEGKYLDHSDMFAHSLF